MWLSQDDIEKISLFLKITPKEFLQKYARQIGDKISLKETTPLFDCIFLKDKKCLIYEVRPKQCKNYPFWKHILVSKDRWDKEALVCEGINEKAPIIPFTEIEKKLKEVL